MKNINDFRNDPIMQVSSQRLSFWLAVLWASSFSSRLSDRTKQLVLNAVKDYGDWSYSFNHNLRLELRRAIVDDSFKYMAERPDAIDLNFTN